MGLQEYHQKRNFGVTGEPGGKAKITLRRSHSLRFVIQKHDASRLHYDFRLEMGGVLKSWAVPKGLPWAQAEKHLAVQVEDHPLEYADFEGVIPKGQYGGGTVMLWDYGQYELTPAGDPLEAVRQGKLHVLLAGKKVKGEWALIRIGRDSNKNQWLLMKTAGGMKPIAKRLDDRSVKTDRTMKQIASDRDAEWQSNGGNGSGKIDDTALKSLPKAQPRFIEPMKPKLLEDAPVAGDWIYELKFDGIRALAIKTKTAVQLLSRNRKSLSGRFAAIADACAGIMAEEFVIDGEVVALDGKGRSSFQLLQRSEMSAQAAPIVFYVFDLLQRNGRSLLGLPLRKRKEILEQLLPTADDAIRFSGELRGGPKKLLAEVKRRGLEGIVGKRPDSIYEPGRRSGAWIKIKCVNEQEFVIGGFTPPAGTRKHFGAILVGYYEGKELVFAGKVGTGFDAKSLAAIHRRLSAEERDDCPFADLPAKQDGQWSQGITPAIMRRMHWVNLKFVCEVKFAEWTQDGKLRQPVFLGMREDKLPRDVHRDGS